MRNRKRPFGDFPSAVHIVETFDFFFSGLASGIDVFLSPKDLFFEDEALAKRELCLDNVLNMGGGSSLSSACDTDGSGVGEGEADN